MCVDPFQFVVIGAEWQYGIDVLNGTSIAPYDSILSAKFIKLDTTNVYRVRSIVKDTAGTPDTTYSQVFFNDSIYYQFGFGQSKRHPGVFVKRPSIKPLTQVQDIFLNSITFTTLHKKDHKVTVPAGTFTTDVYKVELASNPNYFFLYFTACLGTVKIEEYSPEDKLMHRRFLVDLKLP